MRTILTLVICLLAHFSFSQTVTWNYSVDCSTNPLTVNVYVTISGETSISNVVCTGFNLISCTANPGPTGGFYVVGSSALNGSNQFTLSYTDGNGVIQSFPVFTLPSIFPLAYSLATQDYCGSAPNGAATITIGNPNMQFGDILWSNGQIGGLSVQSLPPNSYFCSVFDEVCGTWVSNNFSINQYNNVSISIDQVLNPCASGPGNVDITASNGSGNFDYLWTGPNNYSSIVEDPTDIPTGGSYNVSVSDVDAPTCSNNTTVSIYSGYINGDFDCNCVVGTTDLMLLLQNYNVSNPNPLYDLDGDGLVNGTDLLIWIAALGTTC